MRISDWSSDVCSSDLKGGERLPRPGVADQMNMDGRRAVAVNDVQAIVTEAGSDGVEVSRWLAVEDRKRRRGRQQDRPGNGFQRTNFRGVGRRGTGGHRETTTTEKPRQLTQLPCHQP